MGWLWTYVVIAMICSVELGMSIRDWRDKKNDVEGQVEEMAKENERSG